MQIIKIKAISHIPNSPNYVLIMGRGTTVVSINAATGESINDAEINDLIGCWPLIYFKSAVKGVIRLRRFYEQAMTQDPLNHKQIDTNWQGHMLDRDGSCCIMSEELFNIFNQVLDEQLKIFQATKVITLVEGKTKTLVQMERYIKRNVTATIEHIYNATVIYSSLYCVNMSSGVRWATNIPVMTKEAIVVNYWRGLNLALGPYAACFTRLKEPLKNLMACFVPDDASASRKFLAAPMIRTIV